jgi:hypothetical protein
MLFKQISKSSNLQSKNEVFVREISLSEQCLDFASQAARWPTRAAAIRWGVGALYLAMSAKPRYRRRVGARHAGGMLSA